MAVKYTVIIEKSPNNYGAFSPDAPGCISVADTYDEMLLMIREALEFHLECMELDGYPIPTPTARIEMLETAGREYVIVYEKWPGKWLAYIPDFLPACDVQGSSYEEAWNSMQRVIAEYLGATERSGDPLPEPSAWAETMEIPHSSEVPA